MLIIGNGESRQTTDLSNIEGIKIGCNAICRDVQVDHLICVDRRMVQEAIDLQFKGTIYTRQDWVNSFKQYNNVTTVPDLPYDGDSRMDQPFQWGSGPYAVLLGAYMSPKFTLKLIGFDLFSETGNVNNIYKDTLHYDKGTKDAIDPRYWIYQIGKVFECFPKNRFIVYQKSGWKLPDQWRLGNVFLDNINNL